MKKIALLCHSSDNMQAKQLVAALRSLIDAKEYEFWQKNQSTTAFEFAPNQLEDAIATAWSMLVVVGKNGVDEEFANLAQGAIQQRLIDDGNKVGRLVIRLAGSQEPPAPLRRWVSVPVEGTMQAAAQLILERLQIKARWSRDLAMDAARACIPEGPGKPALVRHYSSVAKMLADGKPVTLMVGAYVSVEEEASGESCPSKVRQRLLEMIQDERLRRLLKPLEAAADQGALPPLLWHDHLASLCLLTGRTRKEIADTINSTVAEAPGDEAGPPAGLFRAIGAFAAQLKSLGLPRQTGLPAITVLTVCPGLRIERALLAHGCAFERAVLLLGSNPRSELHRMTYSPNDMHRARADEGADSLSFMPDGGAQSSADEVEFVRLVKLFGSRDLDQGEPSGDLSQSYGMLSQLRSLLEDLVCAAGTGPYLMLGGGLGAPSVQAAHSVLLRDMLEKPEKRPRLAIVPETSASPDPLRQAEDGHIRYLTAVPDSGLNRLEVVPGDPACFLNALTVAFGGSVPQRVEAA